MTAVTIVSDIPDTEGWAPILRMVELLTTLLGADRQDVYATKLNRLEDFLYYRLPRRRGDQDRVAICITRASYVGRRLIPAIRAGGFSRVVLWSIDSFWTDEVDRDLAFLRRNFDTIVHMKPYDRDFYRDRFGDQSLCLQWGADVLDLGTDNPDRPVDLQRVGRQPASWDDDGATAQAAAALGLRYQGRPPVGGPVEDVSGKLMREYYGRAKFLLAHSNVAAPAAYTHPTKAYITGRWTEALASGASIAGMPPEGDLELFDWPEALLPFPSLDRDAGLRLVAEAVEAWSPQVARRNYLGALRRLDWRWRFRTLVDALGLDAPLLNRELERLEQRIAHVSAEASPGNVVQTSG